MAMAPGLSRGVRGPPDMSLVLFWALLFSLLLDLLLLLAAAFTSGYISKCKESFGGTFIHELDNI